MTTRTTTRPLLDSPPIPVQAKLAAAWTSFMFFYIYVDYLHLYKPGVVSDILNGIVFVFPISVTFVVTTLALLAVPMFMVLLSAALPPRANRITNLVVATLYVPFTVYNVSGAGSWWPFYVLAIVLECVLLAFILRTAWTWPRTLATPADLTAAGRHVEPIEANR
ncbi:MAG: hypothetical protein HZY73_10265 [Micropruina sp.]|nr:MAG: hypothetical protein HZY73_10265 [Micropruina sp.]